MKVIWPNGIAAEESQALNFNDVGHIQRITLGSQLKAKLFIAFHGVPKHR